MYLPAFAGEKKRSVSCRFYVKGFCRNGDNCPFLHQKEGHPQVNALTEEAGKFTREQGKEEESFAVTLPSQESQTVEKENKKSERRSKPSNYFRNKVNSDCKKDVHKKLDEGQKEKDKTVPQAQEKADKKQIVCRFYARGFCARGSSCPFFHDKLARSSEKFRKRSGPKNMPKSTATVDTEEDPSRSEVENAKNLEHQTGEATQENKKTDSHLAKNSGIKNFSNDRKSYLRRFAVPRFIRESQKYTLRPAVERTPEEMRKMEVQLLLKKFPVAIKIEGGEEDGGESYEIVFVPSDPDWPFDVKEIYLVARFPNKYPLESMEVSLAENDQLPNSVKSYIGEAIKDWISSRHESSNSADAGLLFRPFLKWLDKNIEQLMTEALKQYRKELMIIQSGLQFISANQLRETYHGAVQSSSENGDEPSRQTAEGRALAGVDTTNQEAGETSKGDDDDDDAVDSEGSDDDDDDKEENGSTDNEDNTIDPNNQTSSAEPIKKGTEARLNNLELSGVATLTCSKLKVTMSCSRCTNKIDVAAPIPSQSGSATFSFSCPYCSNQGSAQFNKSVVHSACHSLGYFDLEGCQVVDLVLNDCQFSVVCFNCMKGNTVNSLFPGQPNDTWCLGCHQKLSVKLNNVKVIRLEPTNLWKVLTKTSAQVESNKKVKSVKDPAIQDGLPLPMYGTCKHFKKSFRWFRFPCCGKAYPCDMCHSEAESHEMKLANRIICGFCAMEQPYSPSNPCVRCGGHVVNKFTPHWEGGKGCRDKIKMSRGDAKKYSGLTKAAPSSGASRVTRLRHSE